MNKKEIIDKSKLLWNKKFSDFVVDGDEKNVKNKGLIGNIIEQDFYKMPVNNKPDKDFKYFNVDMELKTTPVCFLKKETKDGHVFSSKERLVLSMIDYYSILENNNEELFDSKILNKINDMLIIVYKDTVPSPIEKKVNCEILFSYNFIIDETLTPDELIQMKTDYKIIVNKIKSGNGHTISESDTKILGATRKGGGNKTKKERKITLPNDDTPFFKRAFCLKQDFMTKLQRREYKKIT